MFIIQHNELSIKTPLTDIFPLEKGLGTCARFHGLAFDRNRDPGRLEDLTFDLEEGFPCLRDGDSTFTWIFIRHSSDILNKYQVLRS